MGSCWCDKAHVLERQRHWQEARVCCARGKRLLVLHVMQMGGSMQGRKWGEDQLYERSRAVLSRAPDVCVTNSCCIRQGLAATQEAANAMLVLRSGAAHLATVRRLAQVLLRPLPGILRLQGATKSSDGLSRNGFRCCKEAACTPIPARIPHKSPRAISPPSAIPSCRLTSTPSEGGSRTVSPADSRPSVTPSAADMVRACTPSCTSPAAAPARSSVWPMP